MKIINLNESQFTRLFEGNGDSNILNGEDNTSELSSEVSTQTLVSDPNGKKKTSKPISTKCYANQLTSQQGCRAGSIKTTNTL